MGDLPPREGFISLHDYLHGIGAGTVTIYPDRPSLIASGEREPAVRVQLTARQLSEDTNGNG